MKGILFLSVYFYIIYLTTSMFTFVIRKEVIHSKIRKISLTSNNGYILDRREVISDSSRGKGKMYIVYPS